MMAPPNPELVSNRRALHDFEVFETFEAGIVLVGTEIKSLRNHGGSLQDAYVDFKGTELWLMNSSIAPYSHGNLHNHEDKRPRKVLMHKNELHRLHRLKDQKNMTFIPLSIFLKKGFAKLRFGAAKGKKSYDKRASIKERDQKRAIDRGEE
jgi:SsrA-binding protein